MKSIRTCEEALAFVQEHGVVLASAKGAAPRLAEAIVGEPINGSWWAHPKSRLIFAILTQVTESKQVLVCRLVDGKITLVHRRLWPALARLAGRFAPEQIARVDEEHTASGRHVVHTISFPHWVPADVLEQARSISDEDALRAVGSWLAPSRGSADAKRPRGRSR
jgi:hypothetical protein